jgi:hypothetical protein
MQHLAQCQKLDLGWSSFLLGLGVDLVKGVRDCLNAHAFITPSFLFGNPFVLCHALSKLTLAPFVSFLSFVNSIFIPFPNIAGS